MNAEIKARWVAWLRANVDKQGQGKLRGDDDKFCCLGGLCELAVEDGIITRGRLGVHHWYGHPSPGNRSSSHLPEQVEKWAGLNSFSPKVSVDGREVTLVDLNDDPEAPWDFNRIADIIEQQL
jgi:hypothetical protein